MADWKRLVNQVLPCLQGDTDPVPSAKSLPPPLAARGLAPNFKIGKLFRTDSLFKIFPIMYFTPTRKGEKEKKNPLENCASLERSISLSLSVRWSSNPCIISTISRRKKKKILTYKHVILRRVRRDSEASKSEIRENRHHRGITR